MSSLILDRDEEPIEPKPEGGLATFYDVAVPDQDEDSESAGNQFDIFLTCCRILR